MITCFTDDFSLAVGVQPDNGHRGFTTQGPEIHVVWEQSGAVKYKKSMDEGQNWTSPITIGGTTNEVQLTKCIAADGNYIHVVYTLDSRVGGAPPQLKYVRSVDGGTTWESEVTLDNGASWSNNQFLRTSIIARGGYVHVFYTVHDGTTFVCGDLYYRRSTDNGTTFASRTSLVTGSGAGRPDSDFVGPTGSTIHLAWTDDRHGTLSNGGEAYYKRSTDNGASWGSDVRMSNNTYKSSARSTVAAEGDSVVYAWQYPANTGPNKIYRKYSTDGGVTWSSELQIASSTSEAEHPTLAYRGGVCVLVYTNWDTTPHSTWTRKSLDGGNTWDTAIQVYVPDADSAAALCSFTTRFCCIADGWDATDGFRLTRAIVRTADPSEVTLLDNFNRASLGSNWTTPGILTSTDGLVILSSVALARGASGAYRQGAYWNVAQFGDVDFVCEISQVGTDAGDGITIWNRVAQPGAGTADGYGYAISYNGTNWDIEAWEVLNGSSTPWYVSTRATVAVGDKIAQTTRGNLIIVWYKAAAGSWTPLYAYIDDTYTSGYVGIELLNDQDVQVTNCWAAEITYHRLFASADSVDGSWTDQAGGTSLAAAIDETTPSDSDYIKSEADPTNSGCRVKITSSGDPGSSVDHSILWRVGKLGTDRCDMTLKIYQGGGNSQGAGTLIAQRTRSAITAAFVTYQEDLVKSEIDAITNWTDLYAEFYANTP